MTTDKQIAANKKNAKRAGVKTPEGKAISRRNSLKHGILSRHLYIFTGEEDDYVEFVEFRHTFFAEMCPVGLVETLLVDRLFSTFWRLRRLHIAETGFIKKQVEPHFMQEAVEKIVDQGTARKDIENGFFRQMRTSIGCSHLANGWQAVVESMQEKGLPLSVGMTRALNEELGGNSGFWKAEYVSQFNWIVQNKGGSKPMNAEEEKKFNECALDYAKQLCEMFQGFAEILKNDEEDVRKADLQSKMIPPPAELERIQRYDAHLQRVLLQTLHELQRVQSVRMGRPAPLAAALDVTVDSENGFVS